MHRHNQSITITSVKTIKKKTIFDIIEYSFKVLKINMRSQKHIFSNIINIDSGIKNEKKNQNRICKTY